MKHFKIYLLFFAICIACTKDENPVPRVSVNIWKYDIASDPELTNLLAPFNGVVVTGGYKLNGIIIYRLKNEGAFDDFVAYDRTCPYESSTCVMVLGKGGLYNCTCKCCGSVFNLYGGYMENGKTKYPLRKYSCDYIEGSLHIY